MPGLDGEAYCSTAWDPDGPGPQEELLVVGGYFRIAGNVAAGSIAAWDGEQWHALGEGSIGRVTALTVYNGDLLAASRYSVEPDMRRWTGVNWEPMDFGLQGAQIDTFTTYQGDLIAGGSLSVEGAEPSANIARWDGAKWRPLGQGTTQDTVAGRVHALAVYEGDLIAGGAITSAGGNPVKRIARWDGVQWQDMAGGVESPYGRATVNALLVANDELIVGGAFNRAGGLQTNGIARWNGEAWNPLGSLEWIDFLALYRSEIIAAGYDIHRWNGQAWTDLGLGLSPGDSSSCEPVLIDPEIRSLTAFRDELVAAGASKFAGGEAARHVASWDGENWRSLGTGFSVPPRSLLSHEGKLIAADGFQTLSENSRGLSFISSWDGHAWEALEDAVDGKYFKLASYQGDLIIAGYFRIASEPTDIQHVARWDGSQWRPLGDGVGDSYDCDGVSSIVKFRNELVVGGDFSEEGETQFANLAGWDGHSWHALGTGAPSSLRAMTVRKDALIVGGGFLSIGGVPARNIASWNGATWKPLAEGLDGTVIALTTWGDDLVALYWWNGRQEHTRGARWNGESWVPMGTTRAHTVSYMMAYNGELFAFGDFDAELYGPIHGAIKWNGIDWELIPGIEFPGAWSVTIHEGNMIVGGSVTLPDGTATPNLSIWGPTHARGDYDGDRFVDLTDLSRIPECLTGPSNLNLRLATSDCLCVFNSEGDGDIDLMDVGVLQNRFTRK